MIHSCLVQLSWPQSDPCQQQLFKYDIKVIIFNGNLKVVLFMQNLVFYNSSFDLEIIPFNVSNKVYNWLEIIQFAVCVCYCSMSCLK